jgi:hypothetical protein
MWKDAVPARAGAREGGVMAKGAARDNMERTGLRSRRELFAVDRRRASAGRTGRGSLMAGMGKEDGASGQTSRRSRRDALAGAAGALGVLAAESLVRATPARAADGDPVILGQGNIASSFTIIQSPGGGVYGIASNGISAGVLGRIGNESTMFAPSAGVVGTSHDGVGVHGVSDTNAGVKGLSSSGAGVNAQSTSGVGVFAQSSSGAGVQAQTSTGFAGVYGLKGTASGIGATGGVVGDSHDGIGVSGVSATSVAVRGTSASGDGVEGYGGGSGIGVYGQGGSGGGNGVQGYAGSTAGAGVYGVNVFGGRGILGASDIAGGIGIRGEGAAVGVQAAVTGSGVALDVQGPAKFSRSGTVVIPAGRKTATVTPAGGLTSSALVFAMMQNVVGGVIVTAAVPNPGAGTFQIILNKAPTAPAAATVAWLVVN